MGWGPGGWPWASLQAGPASRGEPLAPACRFSPQTPRYLRHETGLLLGHRRAGFSPPAPRYLRREAGLLLGQAVAGGAELVPSRCIVAPHARHVHLAHENGIVQHVPPMTPPCGLVAPQTMSSNGTMPQFAPKPPFLGSHVDRLLANDNGTTRPFPAL